MLRYLLALSLLLSFPALARPVRVCLVGDSITAGFSPSTRGWSVDLKALHPRPDDFGVKNVAHSGDTVSQAAAILAKEVLGRGCTHVVLLIGTNDVAGGTSSGTILAGIEAMADLIRADTSGRPGGAVAILAAILPRATGAGFTAAREATRVAVNAGLAAYAVAHPTGAIHVDTDTALRGTASGTAWAPSTAYSLDDVRVNGGKAYVCTTAGTSAGSGGPTGTGTSITDGSAVWKWVPALGTEYGGATDGLHPNNTGMAQIAATVDTALIAAVGW